MTHSFARRCSFAWFIGAVLCAGIDAAPSAAQLYNPSSVPAGNEISDTLTDKDIPTGEGGFARDYKVKLESNDQVAIDLTSEEFDAIVKLIASDGSTVAENDDGPDGSTNSLLFARITETGDYIIRVRAFGETGSGKFKLKVTRLRPI
ncbi:PPC domain-containing protein [Oscillatoria sp. FACHB-1406]|uniref:PPC domain-containing protein n=1 Tax=Oscillatoria sp. FACHB-1406 TaxID=2692846 RepID=UPI0016859792|nr:PPC domain-containing protein [Oscillatoria sp. FACHB-1406]MBD2579791.1 PPC domain-containing protein [Oscillatoria sp. FACHB-1406]